MTGTIIIAVAVVAAFWVYLWSVLARERGWWFSWWLGVPILLIALACSALRLGGYL